MSKFISSFTYSTQPKKKYNINNFILYMKKIFNIFLNKKS